MTLGRVRKILLTIIMAALFIGGMIALIFGLEVWLEGGGGFVGPMMIFGGGLFATAGVVTLAEDFAEAFLQPKSAPPATPPGPATQAPAASPPDYPRLPPG